MDTGATVNSIAGHRFGVTGLRGDLNCYYKTAIYIPTNTSMRVFAGFIGSSSAPTSSADPLNALSGVALWLDTAVSANWKIMHNDGSGASTVDDTSVAAAVSTQYPVEIYHMRGPSKWRVVFNGTFFDITTDKPGTTTNLGFYTQIENLTAASRTMRIYYEIIKSDK
jgi:hypothetical protein